MSIAPLITQQAYACTKLPRWYAHSRGSQHQKVSWEYSSFTETIISRKQRAVSTFTRTSLPPNGDYSAPQNIKVRSMPAAWAPGPPVLACRSAACTVAAWVVVRRAAIVWKDTSGEVTIYVCVLYCVVRPKGTTIWGLHGVYFSPTTTLCPKSLQQGVALTGRDTTGPLCAAPWWVTLHMRCVTDDADRRQTPATITNLALPHYV